MADNAADKLEFLRQENQLLIQELNDLKEIISVNKSEIDILSNQLHSSPESRKLIDVIYSYRQRDENRQQKIESLQERIKTLTSEIQNLIFKQMNEEQSEQIRNVEAEGLAAVKDLHHQFASMEQRILFYERSYKEYDKVGGFVFKNKDVLSPIEISMQAKDKEIEIISQLEFKNAELEQAKKDIENLMIVNTVLRNKVVTLQAKLAMPNRNMGEILDKSHRRLMIYFLEMQNKILKGNDDSQSEEEDEDFELRAPEIAEVFPEKQLRLQKGYGVPQLDLLKIRENIVQGTNNIQKILKDRNRLTDKQRIEKYPLQLELEYTRREHSKNIIDLRSEKIHRKQAQALVSQLEQRNLLLVRSNQHLEVRLKRYWQMLRNSVTDSNIGFLEQIPSNLDTTVTKNEPAEQSSLRNGLPLQHMVPSQEGSPLECKIVLQMMARDISKNQKLKNIKGLVKKSQRQPEKRTLFRSSSNPFLYINERKDQTVELESELGNERLRLQQTSYPAYNHGFEEVLDDQNI